MPLTLDHAVVVVPSLEAGVAAFEAAGFTVSPGGRHQELPTENALVPFADGCYLELLAARDPELRPHLAALSASGAWPQHLREATALGRRFLPLLAGRDGVADLVLHGSPLARLARESRARGHVLTGPTPMRRQRSDGVGLAWQLLLPENFELPFMIEDTTARALRVPGAPEHVSHANGASGIASVAVGVASVPVAAMAWADLLGLTPRVDAQGETVFAAGEVELRLSESERPGARSLTLRGARPLGDELAAWGVSADAG